MQLFGKKQAEPSGTSPAQPVVKNNSWFSNNKRSISAVALIVLAALLLRTVFSYGISADSEFALSGGVIATEHLNNIVEFMTGNFSSIGGSSFYPEGSVNAVPVLIDILLAGLATVIKAVTGMSDIESASLALGATAPIVGALACIPMYYLGKEVFDGKKRAGFLAALFLAFCPVAVTNTVFSNGSEIAFVLLFFICALLFIVKGLKALNCDRCAKGGLGEVFSVNGKSFKYALLAGIVLTLAAYTWNGFRPMIVLSLLTMGVMVIYHRVRGTDPRPVAFFFSIIVALPIILAAPYYIAMGLWDLVLSGILIATVIGVVCCVSFAMLKNVPWTTTLPAYALVLIALFVVLNFAAPSLFNDIVSGNVPYSDELSQILGSTKITFSEFITYYGFMTAWCAPIVAIYMVAKFKNNASNVFYVAAFVGLIVGIILAFSSTMAAVVFSPIFAIGFAGVILWVFDTISFSDYFKSFRGCDAKTLVKRIFSPKPFVAILCVVMLVGAPNAIGAMDASISYNEKSDMNDDSGFDLLGALGYTVYTKDDYRIKDALVDASDINSEKQHVIVTWMDYSTDVSLYGNFISMTDNLGNNTVPMANIFLADETRGEATAAIIVFLMENYGTEKSVKIIGDLITGSTIQVVGVDKDLLLDEIRKALDNPHSLKQKVLQNPDFYGDLSTNVTDQNVKYIYLKKLLTQGGKIPAEPSSSDNPEFEGFSIVELTAIYNAISDASKLSVDYVMGTLSMIPIQYGDGSVFSTIAAINGYNIDSEYGYVPEFYSYYSGSYSANATMKNTLLYKLVMGKTSEEASDSGDSAKFESVYQLCNFEADYDHFKVRFNAKDDASADADGWEDIYYEEAYQKKAETGKGTINPYAFPILAQFVPATEYDKITGQVTRYVDADTTADPVRDARVEFWADDGKKVAMAYTDRNGYYELPLLEGQAGANAVLKIFVGTANTDTTGGSLIYSADIAAANAGSYDVNIPLTTFSGSIDFSDEDDPEKAIDPSFDDLDGAEVTLTPDNHEGVEYTFICDDYVQGSGVLHFQTSGESLFVDTYSVKVTTAAGTSLGSATYKIKPGNNSGYIFIGTISEVTLTVTNEAGAKLEGVSLKLSGDGSITTEATDIFGVTKVNVSPGKYNVVSADNTSAGKSYVIVSGGDFTVSGSTSSQTVKVMEALKVTISKGECTENALYVTDGTTNYVAVKNGAGNYEVNVPLPAIRTTTKYYAYQYDNSKALYWATFEVNNKTTSVSPSLAKIADTVKVDGLLKNNDKKGTAGTVTFIAESSTNAAFDGFRITVTALQSNDDKDEYKYFAYLPANLNYTVYATDSSSQVKYIQGYNPSSSVNDDNELDITMEKGYKLSVTYRWGGSSNDFRYATVKVDCTNDTVNYTFYLATDSSGKATLILENSMHGTVYANVYDGDHSSSEVPEWDWDPESETSEVLDGTYYFAHYEKKDETSTKTYFKHYDFSSDNKTTKSFRADVLDINFDQPEEPGNDDVKTYKYGIKNETGIPLKIAGSSSPIEDGKTYYSTSSLNNPYITIELDYYFVEEDCTIAGVSVEGGYYYYCSAEMPIDIVAISKSETPIVSIKSVDSWFTKFITHAVNEGKFVKIAIAYGSEKPSISLTNIREDDLVSGVKPFDDLTIKDDGTINLGEKTFTVPGCTKAAIKYISYNTDNRSTDDPDDIGLKNPYLLKVSYTKGDAKKVYYQTLLGDEKATDGNYTQIVRFPTKDTEEPGAVCDLEDASYFGGVTGLEEDGKLVIKETVNDTDNVFTVDIDDGTFEVLLPLAYVEPDPPELGVNQHSYTIKAYQEKEIDDLQTIQYSSEEVTIDATLVQEKESTYIVNAPVKKGETVPTNATNPTITLSIGTGGMTPMEEGSSTYKIVFTITFANFADGTYVLSPGSDWMHLTIFNGSNEAIETITVNGAMPTGIYAIGYAKMGTTDSTAAYDSKNLSVVAEKLNGDEYAKGTFGSADSAPANWVYVNPLEIELEFGTNKFGTGERVFTAKLTNHGNYPIKFSLLVPQINADTDLIFMLGFADELRKITLGTPDDNVIVAGGTSTTVMIKVISNKGEIEQEWNVLKFKLTETDSHPVDLKKVNDDDEIEITDKVAEFTSEIEESSIDIHSETGGGVFDDLGTAPKILTILAAIIILELIIFFWIAFKKGVFARKK